MRQYGEVRCGSFVLNCHLQADALIESGLVLINAFASANDCSGRIVGYSYNGQETAFAEIIQGHAIRDAF